MDSEAEKEGITTPKLPLLLANPYVYPSPERPNMFASPLHTSASIPFCWEEEPGKPKHSTSSAPSSNLPAHSYSKCLELPPRLLIPGDAKRITKLHSPSSILEGPYTVGRSSRFESSSFRTIVLGSECYGSFRGNYSPAYGETEEKQLGALVLAEGGGGYNGKSGLLGFWRRKRSLKGKKGAGVASYVFSSSVDRESEFIREGEGGMTGSETSNNVKITRINREESFYSLTVSRSHFWATVYEGLKQVVPWKSKKLRRGCEYHKVEGLKQVVP